MSSNTLFPGSINTRSLVWGIVRFLSYRFTSDAGIGLALRIDVVDGDVVDDDTDMPEFEGLILPLGVAHAPLAVATEVTLAEGPGDEVVDFCGVTEPPGLLTVI